MAATTEKDCDANKLEDAVEAKGVEEILAGLTEQERLEIPDDLMPLRHFRAEKGEVSKALEQMKATLAWRKEFQVETLRNCFEDSSNNAEEEEDAGEEKKDEEELNNRPSRPSTTTTAKEFRQILLEEAATGKIYTRGYDKDGRAVVYMRPGRENTHNELNNMRHLVYNMEKAIAITERQGFQKIVFVIDYTGFSLLQAPPLSTSRYTLEIMQRHYPERCHRFYLTNPPFVFKAIWAAIKPFVDPHTKEKMVFSYGKKGIAALVEELGGDATKLEACAGGTNVDNLKEFDHEEYLRLPLNETFDEELFVKME